MATPTTVLKDSSAGELTRTVTSVVLSNSYTTNGEALTARQLGLSRVIYTDEQVKVAGAGACTNIAYDIPNAKIKAFTASAEVANAVDLSAVTVQVTAYGYK